MAFPCRIHVSHPIIEVYHILAFRIGILAQQALYVMLFTTAQCQIRQFAQFRYYQVVDIRLLGFYGQSFVSRQVFLGHFQFGQCRFHLAVNNLHRLVNSGTVIV